MPNDTGAPYRLIDRTSGRGEGERAQVVASLLAQSPSIAPRYFYDDLGCALYGAICRLPEYYPTRTEIAIFRDHRDAIAEAAGARRQFVDLGAGDCCKAEAWLPYLNPSRYIAVDIAAAEIARALTRMAPEFPETEMVGVVTDFSRSLDLEDVLEEAPVTFFYPGSSIGNFSPAEAVAFMGAIRRHCASRPDSGLLIGVDGKKAKAVLDAAYDDALGVTAAFNRNVLVHLNRRFGFDFAIDGFAHRGFYNEEAGRIEMHLESLRDQVVSLGGSKRRFARGERIHTENSYKYAREEFAAMLRDAGFAGSASWSSPDGGYHLFFAR